MNVWLKQIKKLNLVKVNDITLYFHKENFVGFKRENVNILIDEKKHKVYLLNRNVKEFKKYEKTIETLINVNASVENEIEYFDSLKDLDSKIFEVME